MAHYRLYFMNSRTGHISRAEDLLAVDDLEAMETAAPLVEESPVELWCGARKVHRFEAPPSGFLERYRANQADASPPEAARPEGWR